ncbi:hypothetical protein PISL3812_09516 [Talaromyces islandicus]|uniref:Carrier domain-containing protein n=1 Tax=Talaromyces islandicus TaxID=28573 RepID=A0A0U1MBY6_TALIS|nr:hypothetical protein PISL3812_09516 [Talaromyces islandicus]
MSSRPCLIAPSTLTAAWIILLSRYAGADSIEVQFLHSGESTHTDEIAAGPENAVQSIKDNIDTHMQGNLITSSNISGFPLAENRGFSDKEKFYSSICIDQAKTSTSLPLPQCQIRLIIGHDEVSIIVDDRISSSDHDPNLPKRLLEQLELVAKQIEQPQSELTVADLTFMTALDWADLDSTTNPFPSGSTHILHELVAKVAQDFPTADAVHSWDGTLTYAELDVISSSLAICLRRHGVCKGIYVPLFFNKSIWHPVAILSVSKAGGTWVTLPPDMPDGRQKDILDQLFGPGGCSSAIALSSAGMHDAASKFVDTVIQVDEKSSWANAPSEISSTTEALDPWIVAPADVAYIIFTSGTTGSPKGIQVQHQNVCSWAETCVPALGVRYGEPIRQGLMLSYAFDLSIMETLIPLCNGGCLCILSEYERFNDISGAMTRLGVTDLTMTPSLCDSLDAEEFPTIRRIMLGGEPLTKGVVNKWAPQVEVITLYGPAETTIFSHCLSTAGPLWNSGCVGPAFACRCYITESQDPTRRLPRGFIGELLIEGPLVSLGYVNSPAQTQKAYIDGLPWAPSSPAEEPRRFYRTGDVGYLDRHGYFWIKGRNDLQVKIRGQRLELTEVESVLQGCLSRGDRAVADVVVVRGGMKVLVAFLQLAQSLTIPYDDFIANLRTEISTRLLPAFVPSCFLQIDQVPFGATGKTDRNMLKALVGDVSMVQLYRIKTLTVHAASEPVVLKPTPVASTKAIAAIQHIRKSPTKKVDTPSGSGNASVQAETDLREIWITVLGLGADESLEPDSHFFELGGDSILALKLVSLARSKSWTLTARTIAENPTLAAMARVAANTSFPVATPSSAVVKRGPQAPSRDIIARELQIDPESVEDVYPATRLQESLWVLSQTNEATYILQYHFPLPPKVDLVRLRDAWLRVIDNNGILRTRFFATASGVWQVVVAAAFHWEELPVRDSAEARIQLRQVMAASSSLCQLSVLQGIDGQPESLLWTVSHAITDGWASEAIMQAVRQAYRGHIIPNFEPFKTFAHLPLPDPSVEKAYWENQLRDVPNVDFPPLPFARYRPRTNQRLVSEVPLHPQCRSIANIPLVIRAAWAITVSQLSLCPTVVFGMALSGRSNISYDNLLGPMVTTVPLRVEVDRTQTLDDFLRALHGQSVSMMEFEQTGLQRISSFGPALREACKFQNLLVIQIPSQSRADALDAGEDEWLNGSEGVQTSSQPLLVDCLVRPTGVQVRAHFDDQVLSESVVAAINSTFSQCITAIGHQLDGPKVTLQDLVVSLSSPDLGFSSLNSPLAAAGDTREVVRLCGEVFPLEKIQTTIQGLLPKGVYCAVDLCKPKDAVFPVLVCFLDGLRVSNTEFAAIVARVGGNMEGSMRRQLVPTIFFPLDASHGISLDHKSVYQRELQWLIASWTTSQLLAVGTSKSDPGSTAALETAEQEALLKCCKQILMLDSLDLNDNFVMQGGDSIKAIRMVTVLRRAGFRLSVQDILSHPLLLDMAEHVYPLASSPDELDKDRFLRRKKALAAVIAHQPSLNLNPSATLESARGLTPYQQETFGLGLKTPGTAVYQQHYSILPDMDLDRLGQAWVMACEAISNLRARVVSIPSPQSKRGDLVLVVTRELSSLQVIQCKNSDEKAQVLRQIRLSASSLGAPLAHAMILYVEDEPAPSFIWSQHHVVYDHFTLMAIWKVLHEAYWGGRVVTGVLSPEPLLDHIASLDHNITSQFWKRYLSGSSPSSFPPRPSPDYQGKISAYTRATIALPSTTQSSVTMATVLRAAWALTVASYTRTTDIVFQALQSGRSLPVEDIEHLAGPTLAYVPIRISLAECLATSVSTFIEWVQRETIEMMPHEPFGLQYIAAINAELAHICGQMNNMLVIHTGQFPECQPPLPLQEGEKVMELTGFLALSVECTHTEAGVDVMALHDDKVLSKGEAREMLDRFGQFVQAMAVDRLDEVDLTVGSLYEKY